MVNLEKKIQNDLYMTQKDIFVEMFKLSVSVRFNTK